MIQSVALACANLRQGREPGAVGGRYVAFRHLGRLDRFAAENREDAVGMRLIVDRHVVVKN